jgi:acetaldehyde dehydrogenase/alcohol dehydrogenase
MAHSLGAYFDIPHGRANSVFLLGTIDYNSSIPSKFMGIPNYPLWIADRKYARAASFLGLVEGSVSNIENSLDERARAIKALRRAVYELGTKSGQPMCISELGIKKEHWDEAIPTLAAMTFEDMSLKTNPCYPLGEDILRLLAEAYAKRERP